MFELKGTLKGHEWMVAVVAFTPDGSTLTSASKDANLAVWSMPACQRRTTLWGPALLGAALRGHIPGQQAGCQRGRRWRLLLWDLASGSRLKALEGHECGVFGVALSPGGSALVSIGADKALRA